MAIFFNFSQYNTSITWRESQISFALQMLFNFGNPLNSTYLNFGSLKLLLSISDLVPPIISSIFSQQETSILSSSPDNLATLCRSSSSLERSR
uniref:Uncharacterized protein n=1 Tax=Salix viminalis TaxID=40686 RepID=A0A6N2KR30_SALVM